MATSIVIVDGDEVTAHGDVVVIDIDDFNCSSVGDKAERLGRLLSAMDDGHMLDDDSNREAVHMALDKVIDIAKSILT